MSKTPTPEQIAEFLAGPEGPVVMCNLLRLNTSDGTPGDGTLDPEMFAEMMVYAQGFREFAESHGATFVFAGMIDSQVIGTGGEGFQFMSMMRYPSRQVFVQLAADPKIAETIGRNRDTALESQWLFAMTEVTS
ncbi:MAG: hypothetical protein KGR18_11105 [Acidobacteria bacterium]|nr:hypothetical protein [Acidobacteriota bacterium]